MTTAGKAKSYGQIANTLVKSYKSFLKPEKKKSKTKENRPEGAVLSS